MARPSLSHYTSSDGLPVNAVMTLERDGRGFVWFGTQDGAAVFNGHEISVVDMPNRAVSNYIYDILAATDGSLWFATSNGGVHRLKDQEWKTYDTDSGLASNETRALLESRAADGGQVIWVGRRDGLSRIAADGRIENFDEKSGLPDPRVRCLLETTGSDGRKTLWIGTYGGIAVWSGEGKKVLNESAGLPGKIIYDLLATKNPKGGAEVWAATENGPARYADGRWDTFADVLPLFGRVARALGETVKADGTRTVWVGFDGDGVAYLENGEWYFLSKEDGLPNDIVFAFTPSGAPDGSVWISTLGNGVVRFERSNWRSISSENGLPNDIVFAVRETVSAGGQHSFWFGTYGGGLVRFADGKSTVYDRDGGLGNNFVQALAVTDGDDGQTLYAGTETDLLEYRNGRWRPIDLGLDKKVIEVWDIRPTVGENGEPGLLVSASAGLIRKIGDRIERFDSGNGLPDDRVRATLETDAPDGRGKTLWVATYAGGVAKYENGWWSVIDDRTGLGTNRVYALAEIKYGDRRELWIGTGGGGVTVLDLDDPESGRRTYTTENSGLLPSDTVYQIFQDRRGRIYATTNKGVARIVPDESGDPIAFRKYFFTTADGLPNNECIAGASFIDRAGRVWVGTVGGAAVLDLSKEYRDELAEPLFLQAVLIGGKKRELAPGAELGHDQNNLTFEYVMPTNFRESATVYRTQLVGLEETPTAWSGEPRREFTYLPDGDFTFRAWGKDAAGNISDPLEFSFRIRTPWWMTWWAWLLYLLATAAVVGFVAYLVYRNRYRRMLEIERVRTRIATDLHDDIGSSLSKISIISEVLYQHRNGMPDEDRESLKMIADTSREVVGSMSDMVWSINPNRDNFRDTVQRMRRFAGQVLTARDIDFTFDAPKDLRDDRLDVDLRRQLYLVFKESLNNAVKHSGCKRVAIELKRRPDGIFLRVSDDGRGFDPERTGEGNGLNNMRKRAADIGGRLTVESGPDRGTTVTLRLPRRLGGLAFPNPT